ncbi:hypothetical protein L209DRAFT_583052 [Thermothelomyces heterothallicus CBS 203.75]
MMELLACNVKCGVSGARCAIALARFRAALWASECVRVCVCVCVCVSVLVVSGGCVGVSVGTPATTLLPPLRLGNREIEARGSYRRPCLAPRPVKLASQVALDAGLGYCELSTVKVLYSRAGLGWSVSPAPSAAEAEGYRSCEPTRPSW